MEAVQSLARSTPTEPLRMVLSNKRSEGDPPRDVGRVVLRVQVAEMDGSVVVEGHKLHGGAIEHIEVYSDRVKHVEARVRTKEQIAAIELAKKLAKTEADQWIEERVRGFRGTPTERALFRERAERECPVHWTQKLGAIDRSMKSGAPPLLSVEMVSELPPPITPENAARESNKTLAETIAAAIEATKASRK